MMICENKRKEKRRTCFKALNNSKDLYLKTFDNLSDLMINYFILNLENVLYLKDDILGHEGGTR